MQPGYRTTDWRRTEQPRHVEAPLPRVAAGEPRDMGLEPPVQLVGEGPAAF